MSGVVVTAIPVPGHRAEVVAAFEAAIAPMCQEPGVEPYPLHEGPDRLVMVEKYESEQARSEHLRGAALADLRSALEGKLSPGLDAHLLALHPAGKRTQGRAVNTVENGPGYARKRRVRSAICGCPAARDRTVSADTRRSPAC